MAADTATDVDTVMAVDTADTVVTAVDMVATVPDMGAGMVATEVATVDMVAATTRTCRAVSVRSESPMFNHTL